MFNFSSDSIRARSCTVAIQSSDGLYLLGMRRDSKKWSFIGGGMEEFDASPMDCITREIKEECGLLFTPNFIKQVTIDTDNGLLDLYLFHGQINYSTDELLEMVTSDFDPDYEFMCFGLFTLDEVNDLDLHIPKDENELLRVLNS